METMPALLLVDEHEDHRLLLARMLSDADPAIEIREVDRLEKALVALEEAPERFEAVLIGGSAPSDVVLDACRRIRAASATATPPVILALPQLEAGDLQRMFDAGAADWVAKPLRRAELVARVRAAVQLTRETRARMAREAEIEARNRELNSVLAIVRADLSAAARMQEALLPRPEDVPPGMQLEWRLQQSAQIGGDLVGIAQSPSHHAAVWMADVAGHGVAAALGSFAVQRRLTAGEGGLMCDPNGRARAPHEVCAALSAELLAAGDALRYLTLCYLLVDPSRRCVRVVQAGHPPLIVVDAGRARFFEPGDPPVGLIETAAWTSHELHVRSGTRLFVYSDGLPDSRSPDGTRFGQAGVLAAVAEAAALPASELIERVLHRARDHAGGRAFDDDLSLLVADFD